jgi:hypothetical protein
MCFYFKCNSSLFYTVCREGIELLHNWQDVCVFTFHFCNISVGFDWNFVLEICNVVWKI